MARPKPIDRVFYSRRDAIQYARRSGRVSVNLADGLPPMPAPYEPRMHLDGCTLYVHPWREMVAMAWLNSLP
jgi:hypothetical protein